MELPKLDLQFLRTVPLLQKLLLVVTAVVGIPVVFYYTVAQQKHEEIAAEQAQIAKLDTDIQTTTIKVQHLQELIAANKQLEVELAKKRERLPPEEEAVSLLKQLSDLGVRLGLDIKLWKPGNQMEDPSKLFLRLPVSVEVAGGYHTAALFFDRINKLPRIINVSDLRMGSPKVEQERVVIQTIFELTAFVAPPDVRPVPVAAKAP
jgi:type IV pilus assembly protein PilO